MASGKMLQDAGFTPDFIMLEMARMKVMISSHDRHNDSRSDILPVLCSSCGDV